MSYPSKRRRTATSVLAGDFDPRPHRDVLTSLLNGVSMPKPTEEELNARRERRREKKEKEKERRERELGKDKPDKKRVKAASKAPETAAAPVPSTSGAVSAPPVPATKVAAPRPAASSFWQARPQIVIPNVQRSASFSPPPMPSSPPTTPGPSVSSRTSAVSSKRPFTPDDDDDDDDDDMLDRHASMDLDEHVSKKPRKKRPAARKGWKGWVEGSPPPSEKLINLDSVTVLAERKTRSGKSFDAIGAGRDGWV
uniref:N/A n=1 Tax=Ganoderma boninense TaxID=34458 RepID=A0A5K1JSG8_9APHY|nr:N/A [Ganoderma boninense]